MRWVVAGLIVLLPGCSTTPIADLLDYFAPGRIGTEQTPPYGGVCVPQAPGSPAGAPGPPPAGALVPPAPPYVPPPAPPAPGVPR
jgi:hypothetical protein